MYLNRSIAQYSDPKVKLLGRYSKKVNMNLSGNSQMNENANVVALFSHVQVEIPDPLQELLIEAESQAWEAEEPVMAKADRLLVSAEQFPDQSLFILDKQLASLKESMSRLKFYLSDLDDLLPR